MPRKSNNVAKKSTTGIKRKVEEASYDHEAQLTDFEDEQPCCSQKNPRKNAPQKVENLNMGFCEDSYLEYSEDDIELDNLSAFQNQHARIRQLTVDCDQVTEVARRQDVELQVVKAELVKTQNDLKKANTEFNACNADLSESRVQLQAAYIELEAAKSRGQALTTLLHHLVHNHAIAVSALDSKIQLLEKQKTVLPSVERPKIVQRVLDKRMLKIPTQVQPEPSRFTLTTDSTVVILGPVNIVPTPGGLPINLTAAQTAPQKVWPWSIQSQPIPLTPQQIPQQIPQVWVAPQDYQPLNNKARPQNQSIPPLPQTTLRRPLADKIQQDVAVKSEPKLPITSPSLPSRFSLNASVIATANKVASNVSTVSSPSRSPNTNSKPTPTQKKYTMNDFLNVQFSDKQLLGPCGEPAELTSTVEAQRKFLMR